MTHPPQVDLSATESPAISLETSTRDLLTTIEQVLSDIAHTIYLNQSQTVGQATHEDA